MSEPRSVKFLSPEEIATRNIGDAVFIRHAETGQMFRDRELRLRQLAAGHSMRDYLIFMADVAAAQHTLLQKPRDVELPELAFFQEAQSLGEPPLTPDRWKLSSQWAQDLQALLQDLMPRLQEGPTLNVLVALRDASPEHLQLQAERLLQGIMLGLDLGTAPLIGAALQVYWARLIQQSVKTYGESIFGFVDNPTHCPCCGSRPVASVLRVGAVETGTRYLHCSLCQNQWHMVRIKCSHCESTKGVAYQSLKPLEPSSASHTRAPEGAVQAETCDECGHYLKIVNMTKDLYVDPVADDLASLTLDLLVSETGKERYGVNFMLLFGAPEDEPTKA